ncbi:MAG: hypothetical protein PWQ22_1626 [Archaeoglobaceae archaeon]|nr:hypothetical protein [Archaeoglobaceae archaeon]MDK2877216.1 hypothetical protein [Archaeoglobaceae archaeon]
MSRTGEMVLGILGGVFGILAAMFVGAIGGIGEAVGAFGYEELYLRAGAGLLLGALAIVGGAIVNKNNKAGGILMLVSAIFGLFALGPLWVLSFILLLVGGILALRSK